MEKKTTSKYAYHRTILPYLQCTMYYVVQIIYIRDEQQKKTNIRITNNDDSDEIWKTK